MWKIEWFNGGRTRIYLYLDEYLANAFEYASSYRHVDEVFILTRVK